MAKEINNELHLESSMELEERMCYYDCQTKQELEDLLMEGHGIALVLTYSEEDEYSL